MNSCSPFIFGVIFIPLSEIVRFIHSSDYGLWVLIFTCLITDDTGFLPYIYWSNISSFVKSLFNLLSIFLLGCWYLLLINS